MNRKSTKMATGAALALLLFVSTLAPVAHALPGAEIAVSPTVSVMAGLSENYTALPVPMEGSNTPINFIPVPEKLPEPEKPVEQVKAPEAPQVYQPVFGHKVAKSSSQVSELLLGSYAFAGNYKLSFYCPCYSCNGNTHRKTASGTTLTEGRTVAVDKRTIPLGTKIHIEGFGDFIAEDTGSAIKGNRIDVYVSSHAQALQLGIKYANVYVAK